jgi:hypothetical protein
VDEERKEVEGLTALRKKVVIADSADAVIAGGLKHFAKDELQAALDRA